MARTSIHPGEHLRKELGTLGMSAVELSRQIGVPTNRVTGTLNGQRSITVDAALRLAHFFGTNPEFWSNLQPLYELRLAQPQSGKTIDRLPTLNRRGPIPA
jgi:addiction module HigA family antidote